MKKTEEKVSVVQLVRIAAILWIGYLVVLMVLDPLSPRNAPPFEYRIYILNSLNALIVLGLSMWPWAQKRLGRTFLPLVIILMAGGAPNLLPLSFIALVLTAWQYQWRHVVLFCLGVTVVMLGFGFFSPSENVTLTGTLFGMAFITISLLVVGYFISILMTQLRAQQEELEQANAQLVHYASTLEHLTISRERNRMARELHDTLAHTLSGLTVQLETAKAYWDVDSSTAQTMLDKALEATRSGLQETRRALKSLRASPLDDLGLALALRRMAESATRRATIALDLSLPKQIPALSPDIEQCIYRVAQEAVANAIHHANAKNLTIQLTFNGSEVSLVVVDDGLGFKVWQSENSDHFGLAGMRERAQLAGGKLRIDSHPGHGTTIRLSIEDIES
jgi:signal transduction histidine kinase